MVRTASSRPVRFAGAVADPAMAAIGASGAKWAANASAWVSPAWTTTSSGWASVGQMASL